MEVDRNSLHQFWHVDFYDLDDQHMTPDSATHNDIVRDFSELCFLAQNRKFIIRGPATATEYFDNLANQRA